MCSFFARGGRNMTLLRGGVFCRCARHTVIVLKNSVKVVSREVRPLEIRLGELLNFVAATTSELLSQVDCEKRWHHRQKEF